MSLLASERGFDGPLRLALVCGCCSSEAWLPTLLMDDGLGIGRVYRPLRKLA